MNIGASGYSRIRQEFFLCVWGVFSWEKFLAFLCLEFSVFIIKKNFHTVKSSVMHADSRDILQNIVPIKVVTVHMLSHLLKISHLILHLIIINNNNKIEIGKETVLILEIEDRSMNVSPLRSLKGLASRRRIGERNYQVSETFLWVWEISRQVHQMWIFGLKIFRFQRAL